MLKVSKLIDNSHVELNVVNHNKSDFQNEERIFLKVLDTVYPSIHNELISKGNIGLNTFVRNHQRLALGDRIKVNLYKPSTVLIKSLEIIVRLHNKTEKIINIHEDEIKDCIIQNLKNYYLFTDQYLYQIIKNNKLLTNITNEVEGYITKDTVFNIMSDDVNLNIIGSKLLKRDLFRDDYNFEEIGIGGLNKELVDVLRRCLSTRSYKKSVIQKLGIKHVKGLLLYGPSGTGKTLTARRIGNMISNKEPKIVNGPEIMNKFVGESEKNIRELFAEAIADNENEDSDLHIIIFDEIDAICKKRGISSGTGVNDSIVNQLLTMIDGYNSLNNIFIIAMTNRKDLLDEALLRAGRLEVHIGIGLPNCEGREQIFRIHTNNMKSNSMLDPNINVSALAKLTENYSGAEIEAVVRNSAARALHEGLISNIKDDEIIVTEKHFILAIDEVVPSFGNIEKEALSILPEKYEHLTERHKECYNQCINKMFEKGDKRLTSILMLGSNKSGKSVLSTKIGLDSKIKNTKIIRAIDLISLDELGKAYYISDVVKNSYISDESMVIIDDIEIAINYAKMGRSVTFSNRLYQVLLTLLKTDPTSKNRKLCILCTCTDEEFSQEIYSLFDLVVNI